MKIYFSGATSNARFDPHQIDVTKNSYDIFNLDINEREGQFPTATVLIRNPYCGLLNNNHYSHAFISIKSNQQLSLLFAGQIMGVPNYIDGEMMEITLIAKPSDSQHQIQMLKQKLQQAPYWDELFVAKDRSNDLSEILDGRCELPYWSRFNALLKLSNIFWGSQRYQLGQQFFRDKLKFQSVGQPLTSVQLSLKMEWIQKYRGRTNISHLLNSYFPQGLISTFTGNNLVSKWWKKDEVLGKTGYWIEHSQLKPVPALATGVLGLYPAYSSNITLSPRDPLNNSGQPKTIKLKRSWYRASIILGWFYRQKRVEKVTFTVHNRLQVTQNNATQTRSININLQPFIDKSTIERQWQTGILYQLDDCVIVQNRLYRVIKAHLSGMQMHDHMSCWMEIPDDRAGNHTAQQSSFFNTPRGHQAICHAFEIAKAHLAASARAVELNFQAPLEAVMHLTCDHSVQIVDERLPGGYAWGKVKAVRLVVEGHSGRMWGELKLVSSIGVIVDNQQTSGIDAGSSSTQSTHSNRPPTYCDDHYCEQPLGTQQINHPPATNQIGYDRNKISGPSGGILYPDQLSAYDIVSSIKILHGPEQQHDTLIQNQYPVRHNLAAVLNENCTEIILRLKDLQPQPVLEHLIQLSVINEWTAPQQINLQAAKII